MIKNPNQGLFIFSLFVCECVCVYIGRGGGGGGGQVGWLVDLGLTAL